MPSTADYETWSAAYLLSEHHNGIIIVIYFIRASVSGKEQLIFSQADRAAFGGKVTAKANGLLAKAGKTAELTLSPTTGDFQGGLLICDGDVEVNCTFETLVRMVRNEVVGDVTKALFA